MPVDVFEKRKAECDDAFGCALATLFAKRPDDVVNAALEKLVLAGEMRVEGGSAHVRAMQDLLDGDGGVRLFAGEAEQCLSQRALRPLYSPIWSFRTF